MAGYSHRPNDGERKVQVDNEADDERCCDEQVAPGLGGVEDGIAAARSDPKKGRKSVGEWGLEEKERKEEKEGGTD